MEFPGIPISEVSRLRPDTSLPITPERRPGRPDEILHDEPQGRTGSSGGLSLHERQKLELNWSLIDIQDEIDRKWFLQVLVNLYSRGQGLASLRHSFFHRVSFRCQFGHDWTGYRETAFGLRRERKRRPDDTFAEAYYEPERFVTSGAGESLVQTSSSQKNHLQNAIPRTQCHHFKSTSRREWPICQPSFRNYATPFLATSQ